jgi:acyl-CoA synthetase (AMP-forming)/AMP-acid ligase II
MSAATLADLFANADPKHTAVILPEDGSAITYRSLADQVEALAAVLRGFGLEPGETVGIVLPNGIEYLAAFLAVTRARLVAAPLNPAYKAEEFRFSLEDAGARLVMAKPGQHPASEAAAALGLPVWSAVRDRSGGVYFDGDGAHSGPLPAPEAPRPGDTALFLHTSGTTSRPKGVPLTHGNLMASLGNIASHYRLTPADTTLVVMPLFHVHGLLGATLSTFFSGGTRSCRGASAPAPSGPRPGPTGRRGTPPCRRSTRSC